jgi:hypothetical protein
MITGGTVRCNDWRLDLFADGRPRFLGHGACGRWGVMTIDSVLPISVSASTRRGWSWRVDSRPDRCGR